MNTGVNWMRDNYAPRGKWRLMAWTVPENEASLEDFGSRREAEARARELAAERPRIVCMFDDRGKRRLDLRPQPAAPDFLRPTSVTKLAGHSDGPGDKKGRYK